MRARPPTDCDWAVHRLIAAPCHLQQAGVASIGSLRNYPTILQLQLQPSLCFSNLTLQVSAPRKLRFFWTWNQVDSRRMSIQSWSFPLKTLSVIRYDCAFVSLSKRYEPAHNKFFSRPKTNSQGRSRFGKFIYLEWSKRNFMDPGDFFRVFRQGSRSAERCQSMRAPRLLFLLFPNVPFPFFFSFHPTPTPSVSVRSMGIFDLCNLRFLPSNPLTSFLSLYTTRGPIFSFPRKQLK